MKRRRHNGFTYRLEMCVIRLRDRLRSPRRVLEEAGVEPGMTVMDLGCGPGGFSLAAARLVGVDGIVYAVDVQPLALEIVRRRSEREGLANVRPLRADQIADVPEGSVDRALLYDVLHILDAPDATRDLLAPVHRVLKSGGRLSVRDHHLKGEALVSLVTGGGLFRFCGSGRQAATFAKVPKDGTFP